MCPLTPSFPSLIFKNTCFRPCSVVCRIGAPRPGLKPVPSALGVGSLSHWTTREVSLLSLGAVLVLFSPFPPFPNQKHFSRLRMFWQPQLVPLG